MTSCLRYTGVSLLLILAFGTTIEAAEKPDSRGRKPDFTGRWILDESASHDVESEIELRRHDYQLERMRRRDGHTGGYGAPASPGSTAPGAFPPGTLPPGTTPPTSLPPGTTPPSVTGGPRSPRMPPPGYPGTGLGSGSTTASALPNPYAEPDDLAPLVEAAAASGVGALEIEVTKRRENFVGTEDGVEILWALDGSVKATSGTSRNARWRSHRLRAEERLIDGSEISWTWLIRKDGRLQITTRIEAEALPGRPKIEPMELRALYDPAE